MVSISKISLLLGLDVSGPSVLSGMSALVTGGCLRACPREAHSFAEHSRPPSSNLPAWYSQKERSSATLLFF